MKRKNIDSIPLQQTPPFWSQISSGRIVGGDGGGGVQVDVMKPKGFILEYPNLTVAL